LHHVCFVSGFRSLSGSFSFRLRRLTIHTQRQSLRFLFLPKIERCARGLARRQQIGIRNTACPWAVQFSKYCATRITGDRSKRASARPKAKAVQCCGSQCLWIDGHRRLLPVIRYQPPLILQNAL